MLSVYKLIQVIVAGGTTTLPHPHCYSTGYISTVIMEAAISTLVSQFKIYAGKYGSASTLSKEEFQNLVSNQLPNFVKLGTGPGAIDQLMNSLDENNDGELTFSEFWKLIGKLASKQGGLD